MSTQRGEENNKQERFVSTVGLDGIPRQGETLATRTGLVRLLGRMRRLVSMIFFGVVVGISIGPIIETTLRGHGVDLDPISVPKSLVESGFDTEVVTRQLRDAIQSVHDGAQTEMPKSAVQLHSEEKDVTITKADISIESVSLILRSSIFRKNQNRVSGEITQNGSSLRLTLRLNGIVVFSQSASVSEDLGILLKAGAFNLVQLTEPYIAASYLYGDGGTRGLGPADQAADMIISTEKSGDENVRRSYVLKGLIAWQRDNVEQAERFYKLAGDFSPAWSDLAELRFEGQRYSEALVDFRMAIGLDQNEPYARRRLADLLLCQGKVVDAVAQYRKSVQLAPELSAGFDGLGNGLLAQGKKEEAIRAYRTAIKFDEKSVSSHNNLGRLLYYDGNYVEATSEFERALELKPYSCAAHIGLGKILRDVGESYMAIDQFKAIMPARLDFPNPKLLEAYLETAKTWQKLGRLSESLAVFESAIRITPIYVELPNCLGQFFDQRKSWERVTEGFHTAVELNTFRGHMRRDLAGVLLKFGWTTDAVAEFQIASGYVPGIREVGFDVPAAWLEKTSYERAILRFKWVNLSN